MKHIQERWYMITKQNTLKEKVKCNQNWMKVLKKYNIRILIIRKDIEISNK